MNERLRDIGSRVRTTRMVLGGSVALAICLSSLAAVAQAQTAPIEKGQRVYHAGHSFSIFTIQPLELLATEAGFEAHTTQGRSMIGNSTPMQHWNASEERSTVKPTLRAGDVDVLILAAHRRMPEEGIDLFADLAAEHNPNVRLLIYSSWSAWDGRSNGAGFSNEDRDQVTTEEIDGWIESRKTDYLKRMRAQLRGINERHNRDMAFIIDVGNAVYALRKEVIKGNVPGISKQSQLFSDSMGHSGSIVAAVADYATFATVYRKSPVGMSAVETMPAGRRSRAFTPTLSPEDNTKLHKLLQEVALEAVLAEPMSGFKK